MRTITQIVTIVALLIGVYLFLNNWMGATSIIGTIASNTNQSIKTLQGR
jgi:hypothetical protein